MGMITNEVVCPHCGRQWVDIPKLNLFQLCWYCDELEAISWLPTPHHELIRQTWKISLKPPVECFLEAATYPQVFTKAKDDEQSRAE